jgi:hypothetical protein
MQRSDIRCWPCLSAKRRNRNPWDYPKIPEKAASRAPQPLRGRFEAASRHEVVSCDTRHGVVLSPTPEHVMRSETGATRLNIVLKRDGLARQLAALLGAAPDGPLEFAAALRLKEGHGRSLARFARLASPSPSWNGPIRSCRSR